jgi:hypothetical protein
MAKFKFFSVGGEADTDTNTNLGNSDLTADASSRTYKLASGGNVKFTANDDTTIFGALDSGTKLSIGGASPYDMPTARADAQYKSLVATDGSGATSWEEQYNWMVQIYTGRASSILYRQFGVMGLNSMVVGNGNNITFANGVGLQPLIATADMTLRLAKVGLSTDITTGLVSLAMFEGGADDITDFDLATSKTDLGAIAVNGTTDNLENTSLTLTTALTENKWYFFAVENASGGTMSDVFCWLTLYFTIPVKY